MSGPRRLLVLSGGHPYDEPAFADLLDALLAGLPGWSVDHHVHPEAEAAVAAGAADDATAILFYDMPGYDFSAGTVSTRSPAPAFCAALERHFARGGGAVALHHALAGWADWPQWAEWLGGRFLYAPGEAHGRSCLDSGYRHEVTHTVTVLADHPVTAGLPTRFTLSDELYLAEVWADDATPLLASDYGFVAENFYSAAHAVAGRMFDNAGWAHPPGSNLIGWTRSIGPGRLTYLQPGDGPATWAAPEFRQLLGNALRWVSQT